MADNDQLLDQIRKVVREENEPINKRLDGLEQGQKRLEQGQAQTDKRWSKLEDGQAHLITAVEAIAAGQAEIKETMATKADILTLGAKIKKKDKEQDDRLNALEEKEGLTNPHKN